jgi:small conductance mechanosensitive channel
MILLQIKKVRPDSLVHHLSGQGVHWIMDKGPKIIIALIIFLIGQWIIKILIGSFNKILSTKRFSLTLRPFLQNVLKIVLQAILIFGIMQLLGIKMALFAAVIGALGVAAGLALSGTLQNFASGVLIILLKPFVVGDNIKTQGEQGTVIEIRLFYTVVRTFSNITLIVPNNKLSNDVIFNYSRESTLRMDITIKFSYAIDFKDVQKTAMDTIVGFEKGLKAPPPRIGIDKIEADGYTVVINTWINSHGFQDTRLELNEKLMNCFEPFFTQKK